MSTVSDIRFSFILPALNEEACIGACIGSIQAQTERPHEIIVSDNGCTDHTVAIARQLGCAVVCEERPGPSHARNRGAAAASGDVLCFIDVDGTLTPGWLRAAQRAFAAPDVGVASGPSIYVHRSPLKWLWYNLYTAGVSGASVLSSLNRGRMVFAGNNLAIRRELFATLGGYEPVIGEGMWLSQRFWGQSTYRGVFCAGMILWNSPRGFEHHGFLRTLRYWIRSSLGRASQDGYTYRTF